MNGVFLYAENADKLVLCIDGSLQPRDRWRLPADAYVFESKTKLVRFCTRHSIDTNYLRIIKISERLVDTLSYPIEKSLLNDSSPPADYSEGSERWGSE